MARKNYKKNKMNKLAWLSVAFLVAIVVLSIILVQTDGKNHVYTEYLNADAETTMPAENIFNEISASKLFDIIEDGELVFVYMGRPTCPACNAQAGLMNDTAVEQGVEKIYYLNSNDTDEADEDYLIDLGCVTDAVPALFAFEDGKLVAQSDDYKTEDGSYRWTTQFREIFALANAE